MTLCNQSFFLLFFFCLSISSAGRLLAEVRQFTDANGRVLQGELVAVNGDSVTIKREDGQAFTLKTATFSAADQAYFKQAMAGGAAAGAGKKDPPPKITPKDVRDFPFCATMKAVKLNPKQKDMIDELRVTTSDRIRIHGKKKEDSGKVDGKVVYHNGKLALFPPLERSGTITSKHPPTEDVRRHFAVLETGDTLVAEELKLGENIAQAWTLTQESGNMILKISQGGQTTVTVAAPSAQVTGAGFAATARWIGNEVDLSVNFDEPSK
jgi:hypothetical protein